MATPKRPSLARLSKTPCPTCGKDMLEWTDGTGQRCVSGLHALERELGIHRSPPKAKARR